MFNTLIFLAFLSREQPPSGGCVLKLWEYYIKFKNFYAAAFGRLCVETTLAHCDFFVTKAAAFGRLCVETSERAIVRTERLAAAFGRLCVETVKKPYTTYKAISSRLRAAVC